MSLSLIHEVDCSPVNSGVRRLMKRQRRNKEGGLTTFRCECLLASVLTLYALCSACSSPANSEHQRYDRLYAGQEVREVTHPNGLSLNLPASLSVTPTADGFIIEPPPVRSLSQMTIRLHPGAQGPDAGGVEHRLVGGRKVYYRVREAGSGGSGGEEYELSAWELVPGGYISYQQIEQSETGRPGHEFTWFVIERAGFKGGNE